ncbi:PIG-L deacetylase family protein [Vibrio cholerae]|uniref:PIG-L deacetylase family protein n=1 Tax=Vibrio cholerae TaxID=666 RepID=UPI00115BEBD1|nr:PIG-L family deacetylase [Vibrio cholerae]TQQ45233.1 GlcNAc-PI de-N-acetylase [Vibrio cholerae]HDZ9226373.1 PIG-L family deacetylase [Vibrio cholerae]
MIFNHIKRALFISAHPDDTEFGAAGLVRVLVENGVEVHLAVLSNPVESLPQGTSKDKLLKEQETSAKILGFRSDIHFYSYPVRKFSYFRQEILEDLIKLRELIKPDLVVTSSENDYHQDHNTLACEAIRAFKQSILLGYTHPWNTRKVVGNVFFELTEDNLKRKIDAISSFESQSQRNYSKPSVIESLAIEAGIAAGFCYAERFELVTMSVKNEK